jgi:hypothetical protein
MDQEEKKSESKFDIEEENSENLYDLLSPSVIP